MQCENLDPILNWSKTSENTHTINVHIKKTTTQKINLNKTKNNLICQMLVAQCMSVFHSNRANYFQSFHYIYFVKLRNAHILAVFLRMTSLSFRCTCDLPVMSNPRPNGLVPVPYQALFLSGNAEQCRAEQQKFRATDGFGAIHLKYNIVGPV